MPSPIVFRISPLGHIAVFTLVVCVSPVALALPGGLALYLIPIGLFVWIMRVRTTVDSEAVVARGVLRPRHVAWADITALRLRSSRIRSQVSVVLADGAELALPAVHLRDLPLLAEVSGGRLPELASGKE